MTVNIYWKVYESLTKLTICYGERSPWKLLITRPSRSRQPSLKKDSVFCLFFVLLFWDGAFRDFAVQPFLRHCFVHVKRSTLVLFLLLLLLLLNKRQRAVESPSHVYRSSVHYNWCRMCVSMGWIAVEKKPRKTGKQ